MDSTALAGIQQTAIEAAKANRLDTHAPAIVLNAGNGQQRVESLEAFQAHRSRFRGTFSTTSINDFAQYITAREGGAGFIDIKRMAATVFFDLLVDSSGVPITKGEPGKPGHADHRAVLTLEPTAAFTALMQATQPGDRRLKIDPACFHQKALIEWLEDWNDFLVADYPEAQDNSLTDPTRMRQALNALRKFKVKATVESVHTEKDFGGSRSVLEDVEASSDVGLPRGFRFMCEPYDALDQNTFYLRLGVRPDDEKPTFILRWQMRERDIENLGQQFKTKLLDAIGDKATMLLGSFDPGK